MVSKLRQGDAVGHQRQEVEYASFERLLVQTVSSLYAFHHVSGL